MAEMKKKSSQWWWFDNQKNIKRSPWLNSTLSELDEKIEAMLKLIEQDADSFSKRAEMYYKKRPELVNMVGDLYRAHRLLAERYDQVKSESITRLLTSIGSPFSCETHAPPRSISLSNKSYDSCSDISSFDHDENAESEVEDPDEEEDVIDKVDEKKARDVEEVDALELKKLREEIERLKAAHTQQLTQKDEEMRDTMSKLRLALEENRAQRKELVQKDEEKREVIRQLTYAMGMLKEENMNLRKQGSRADAAVKKPSKFESDKPKPALKGGFLKKLFNGSFLNSQATIVAL